ncbi:MAG TPA: YqeG family HAD IIIA-type phosphatase [Coriobacteriia bacterium]
MNNPLSPDSYLSSVHAVDLDDLAARGIRVLLLDLDNTLLPRDTNVVPDELKAWAAGLRDRGFSVCLVSNNWHERVHHVASELGFDLVDKAVKPLPFAFLAALRRAGAKRREAAVIGDQLFTDILGGNMLGMRTVLVSPLSATDLPHTLLLRRLEALVLKDRVPTS